MREVSPSVYRAIAILAAAVMVVSAFGMNRHAASSGPESGTLSNPGPQPMYSGTGLPTLDPDDAKFFGVAGSGQSTLEGVMIVLYIGVPAGTSTFSVGLFDGDVGGAWDDGSASFSYKIYKDPLKNDTTTMPLDTITSAQATNDDWYDKSYSTDNAAKAPSGNFFYRMDAGWTFGTPTGGFNNFKVRTSGQISVRAGQDFGFAAGPQNTGPGGDPWVGSGDPHPGDQNDPNANSYDGQFTYYFYVPTTLPSITFWDGDNDRADDTNDPNTPDTDPDGSGPAVAEGVNPGAPPDDPPSPVACCTVSPSIYYDILDPQGHLFTNDNPSGNTEWERFVIGDTASDPDILVSYELQPGLWRYQVHGMDAHNLNVLRSTYEIYSTTDLPLTVNPPPSVAPDHTLHTPDNRTVYYNHTVTNNGGVDDFDLTAVSDHGWQTKIYADSNGNGVLDPGEPQITQTGPMAPGEQLPIIIELTIPDLPTGATDLLTVTASSRTEWALQGSAEDTTLTNNPPNAHLQAPASAPEGTPVTFDASASTDPDGDPLQFRWDFNDDGIWDTAYSPNATITQTWGDDFTATVRVDVSDGDLNDTANATVVITNVSPTVDLTLLPAGKEGDGLGFEVRVRDPGSDDLTVSWTGGCTGWSPPAFYPNDPAIVPDPDPSPDVHPRDITDGQTVVCGDNGGFAWSVTAQDDDGGVTTVSGTFSVDNAPPTLQVGSAELTVPEGTQFTLTATATDPGSDDLTFTWQWESGPTDVHTFYNDGVGPDPPGSPNGTYPFIVADSSTHAFGDDCACTMTLTVMDDDGGMVRYDTFVEVVNVAPTAAIPGVSQAGSPPGFFLANLPINFTGRGDDPGSDDLTFTWDFGDGSLPVTTVSYNDGVGPDPFPSPGGTFPFSADSRVAHAFAPGDYTVTLTVTDDDRGSTTATTHVHLASAMDLKHEAIKRIKALKELALTRGDESFLKQLDRAERHVWKSLGYKHPFRPDTVTADPAAGVAVRTRDHDKVELTLGPSWAPKLDTYTTLRLTWANGMVTVIDLPSKWPDKDGELRARPWVDAWHQDIRIHVEKEKKSREVTLDVHAHQASLGVSISLDGDRVADLSFTYKIEHLWVDALHLDPKHGKKVFSEERKAVKDLVCTPKAEHDVKDVGPISGAFDIDDKRCPGKGHGLGATDTVACRGIELRKWSGPEITALDKECDAIANLLVRADEILALIALEDAKNSPIQNPENAKHVQHEIEKAEKELLKAYASWTAFDYQDAIKHFGKAWKHAQHAIRDANRP